MKVKTKELIGQSLDWAVAVADKRHVRTGIGGSIEVRGRTEDGAELPEDYDLWMFWYPQASWSQGGPIISRLVQEGMSLFSKECLLQVGRNNLPSDSMYCEAQLNFIVTAGPTPLIAAMRCYVASKLGEEVEIPDALVNL